MKRFFLFAAGALCALSLVTASAQTSTQRKTTQTKVTATNGNTSLRQTKKQGATGVKATGDIKPVQSGKAVKAVKDVKIATEKKVRVLTNDNIYRPGMKVKRLTILDFNATWCGPCKQFAPAFEKAAATYGDKVDFVSVDIDVNGNTAAAFEINAFPTVIFLYPDGKTKRYVGTNDILPAEKFLSLVKQAVR